MEIGVGIWLRQKDGDSAWISAVIQSKINKNDDKIELIVSSEIRGTETFTFNKNNIDDEFDDLKLRNDPSETDVENLINLPYLHEPAILHCLQERYLSSNIYTYTGPILIAINPFKTVSLYTNQILESYYNHGLMKSQGIVNDEPLAPHVYAIADAAYRDMMEHIYGANKTSIGNQNNGNQCILISGESGAGKTESTKIVLKYLTTLGSATTNFETSKEGQTGSVMDKILQSNPILEAFGNARTLRNDNSSRFGKFIELHFNRRGHLIGGVIRTYLLEKVRLPTQQSGERNFHVFYQLLAGSTEEERERWHVNTPDNHWYTSQGGVYKLKHMDDAEEFNHLRHALATLNFSAKDVASLMDVMAGLLHVGQLRFEPDEEGDGSVLEQSEDVTQSLEYAATLLGLNKLQLTRVLTIRTMITRDESVDIKLSPYKANDARDAFSRAIYGQLFDWIVRTINQSIQVDPFQIRAEIGVLDIFGFECFKNNSFEQLCINYTNETLQQQFNQFVFKMEQIEYEREKIEWSFIEFPDNQDCLDLIEHKQRGIFAMLDDECKLPGASDEKFAARLYKAYDGNKRFSTTAAYKRDSKFCVEHYAGPVVYSTVTFVEKNKDELPKEADSLLRSSSVSVLDTVFTFKANLLSTFKVGTGNNADGKPAGSTGGAPSKPSMYSVSSQFKEQLNSLMEKIYSTAPHYIRCLKPNDDNVPDLFKRKRLTEQLRYGGVLEAVRVARSGFPIRLSRKEFYARYRLLANPFNESAIGLPFHIQNTHSEEELNKYCNRFLITLYDNIIPSSEDVEANGKLSRHFNRRVREDIAYWMGSVEIPASNIQLGLTKVFLRKAAHDILESRRARRMASAAKHIQVIYRGYVAAKMFKRICASARLIQRVARGSMARKTTREIRRQRSAILLQARIRGFVAYNKFKLYRNAAICLQSVWRGMKAQIVVKELRAQRNAIRLQRILRGAIRRFKYRRFLHSVIVLQCNYRRRCAKLELIQLRLKAKDLGLLKQSNEALKAEIEHIRAKAAEDSRKLVEKASAAKDVEITRLSKELADLKVKFDAEVAAHKVTEGKLKQKEDRESIAIIATTADFAPSTPMAPHRALLATRAAKAHGRGSPINGRGATTTTTTGGSDAASLLEELEREREARMSLEAEVERLQNISLNLTSTCTHESDASKRLSNGSVILPQRRPDALPEPRKGKMSITASGISKSLEELGEKVKQMTNMTTGSEWTGSSSRSLYVDVSTSSVDTNTTSSKLQSSRQGGLTVQSEGVSALLDTFEKNMQALKYRLKQGYRVLVSDNDKEKGFEALMKLEGDSLIFEPINPGRRFNIFGSKYDVLPIRIIDIHDTIVGHQTSQPLEREKTCFLTILSRAFDQFQSRITYLELTSLDERNTVLTGLRSLVSELHITSPAMRSLSNAATPYNEEYKPNANVTPAKSGSPAKQAAALRHSVHTADLDQYFDMNDLKRQLLLERVNLDKMMSQVVVITNDLSERDDQIADMRKRESVLQQKIAQLGSQHDQDATVRLQLGRRLEQVLIEKEEAVETLEMTKVNYWSCYYHYF